MHVRTKIPPHACLDYSILYILFVKSLERNYDIKKSVLNIIFFLNILLIRTRVTTNVII